MLRRSLLCVLVAASLLAGAHAHAAPPDTPRPAPSSEVPAAPAAAPVVAQGALVIAVTPASRPYAKSLARAVYRDPALRPRIEEHLARALVGEKQSAAPDARLDDALAVLETLRSQPLDGAVGRRLLTSLGRDTRAELVVVVELEGGQPRARVLRVDEGRMLSVVLVPRSRAAAGGQVGPPGTSPSPGALDWSDTVALLRGLTGGAPPPGPRVTPRAPVPVMPAPDGADTSSSVWSSPWLWGGLGAAVAVGVTVFVLSQTALNDPDSVRVEGRVGQ